MQGFERRLGRKATNDEVEPASNQFLDIARSMSADDYLRALDTRNTFSRRFESWWSQGFDILLTPSTGTIVPKLGVLGLDGQRQAEMLRWSAFMRFYNFSGQPAISLPLYQNEDGLPLGIQLGGAYGREDILIGLASQLERALPWTGRVPGVHS